MLYLKELRTQRGLTQDELSKALNVSASSIGMYEQGRREPDNKTLVKIAAFFSVTTDYLLGLADPLCLPPAENSKYQTLRPSSLIINEGENVTEEVGTIEEGKILTHDEWTLILAYRVAPDHIKNIVKTALRFENS